MMRVHRDYSTVAAIAVLGGLGVLFNANHVSQWIAIVAWVLIGAGLIVMSLQILEQMSIDAADKEYFCYRCHKFHKLEEDENAQN